MGSAPLVVASNRGPLSIEAQQDGEDDIQRGGGGGLVNGMQAALRAVPEALWICCALNDRERSLSRRTWPGHLSQLPSVAKALAGEYELRMLPIDAKTFRLAYQGVANSTLWFVLHLLYEPARTPVFDAEWRREWDAYRRYNVAFADAIAAETAPGATVMVQDYHLFLVPRLLRQQRPDLRIGHFTHTPWVPPDYFRMLPDDIGRELLDGMLGADLLGFHCTRWRDFFAACCLDVLGVRPTNQLDVFPLCTDAEELAKRAHRRDVDAAMGGLTELVGDRLVIGRVDRTELSKNVWRGLLAYRELLRTHPEWRDRVVHVICDYPSREELPAYREYVATVERLAADIDAEFATDDWAPVILEISNDYPSSLATLRCSDVVFVNPVRDGMNLVVLEGIVLSERDPVVVLSRNAGSADLLGDDALLVNPFDVSETARALHQALVMPPVERLARATRLREAAGRLPPVAWFQAQIDAVGAAGSSVTAARSSGDRTA